MATFVFWSFVIVFGVLCMVGAVVQSMAEGIADVAKSEAGQAIGYGLLQSFLEDD